MGSSRPEAGAAEVLKSPMLFLLGVNLFAACTVAKISLDRIVMQQIPFVLVVRGCLMLITYMPVISLGLRDLVYR